MNKTKAKIIGWFKPIINSKPMPIYARLGYGKHKEYIYVYEKVGDILFKFKGDTACIEIDRYIDFKYNSTKKKTTIKLYIEKYECDTTQILDMILKGVRGNIYSIDALSREEIAKTLTKDAVVRRMTK